MAVSQTNDVIPTGSDESSLVRQHQRFNWFADKLERWVGYYDVEELAEFLDGDNDWPGQREKAVVLLALTGTDEATAALRSFDAAGESESLRMLREIALDHALSR